MTLNDLMIKPGNKPERSEDATHTPSINLDTILNNPVVAIEKAVCAVMVSGIELPVDSNSWMLVDAAGHAVWGLA